MQEPTIRRGTAIIAVGALALAAVFAIARPPTTRSLRVAEAQDAEKANAAPPRYFGASNCSGCHATGTKNPAFPFALENVKLDEYSVWRKKDKHSIAYESLLGDRAKAMGRRLKLDVAKPEAGCLGCHSASAPEIKNRRQGDAYKLSDGVSCENCHGPAEKWVAHFQSDWRAKTPTDKAALGFNDLREPLRQANKCLSCHVGNIIEGKVVTHAMYAVGHPPLPSIEVATFGDISGRHWRLLEEKPKLSDEALKDRPNYHQMDDSFERSRLTVVSAAVALKATLGLLADETHIPADSKVPGLGWPDYARFDCASCHHELERPSWRQERGYSSTPGRPPVNKWPLMMLALGVDRLAKDQGDANGLKGELKAHLAALDDASRSRPFGGKAAISAAASKFAAWSDGVADRLAKSKYDKTAVAAMLRTLLEEASGDDLDYEAARHVAWSIKAFLKDLQVKSPEIDAILTRFDSRLNLVLPTGRNVEIEANLAAALRTMGGYDPRPFRQDLQALATALPK